MNELYRSINNTINLENLQRVELKTKSIKLYYANNIKYSLNCATISICLRQYYNLIEAWEKYNATNP